VSKLYGMLDNLDKTNVDKKGIPFTVRTVFVSESQSANLVKSLRNVFRVWRMCRWHLGMFLKDSRGLCMHTGHACGRGHAQPCAMGLWLSRELR
jgi:hypothetical protein